MSTTNLSVSKRSASGTMKQSRPTAIEEILGRARSTLDQSRQFRSTSSSAKLASEKPSKHSVHHKTPSKIAIQAKTIGPFLPESYIKEKEEESQLKSSTSKSKVKVPVPGSNLYFRRPGSPTGEEFPKTSKLLELNSENSGTESSARSYSTTTGESGRSRKNNNRHTDSQSNSSGSDDDDDESGSNSENENSMSSTITPPTMTEPLSLTIKKDAQLIVDADDDVSVVASHISQKDIKKKNSSFIAKTMLLRSNSVSKESYAVLEAMISEREQGVASKSSYTEDWITDAKSMTNVASNDSIEVPRTESEEPEIPEDDASKATLVPHDSVSSRIVEEIRDNLQELEIDDEAATVNEDETFHSLDEINAMADLDILRNLEEDDEESREKGHNDDEEDVEEGSSIQSKSRFTMTSNNSEQRQSLSLNKISKTNTKQSSIPDSVSNRSAVTLNSMSTKNSKHSNRLSPAPKASSKITSSSLDSPLIQLSRQSSRKTFQQVLSQIKLSDEEVQKILPSADINYKPPRTKPQNQIQSILQQEVYRKELGRLRQKQKREEQDQKNAAEIKAKNLKELRELEKYGKKYTEEPMASYSKIGLASDLKFKSKSKLKGIRVGESSQNFGAPYFGSDGSVRADLEYQNLPRTPQEDYADIVQNMDIPQLVQEVVASNERMYKMTLGAARQMSKEYGKNAKMVMKLKRSRDAQRRRKPDPPRPPPV